MKLYLAGPDVFRADAVAWAGQARAQCRAAGHMALVPLDGDQTTAQGIFHQNLRLLDAADAVLANLTPFRGAEPDSGTCVEVGYALARGKRVIGYAEDLRPLRERLAALPAGDGAAWQDAHGNTVENFGLPFNLMLSVPLRLVRGGIAEALAVLAEVTEAA